MSSRRQGLLRHVEMPAGVRRQGMNLWPRFLGAGIRVTRVADDDREVDVTLSLGLLNHSGFGTQFGGSPFAMTDRFFAMMMLENLGEARVVRNKAGAIRYLRLAARATSGTRARAAPARA